MGFEQGPPRAAWAFAHEFPFAEQCGQLPRTRRRADEHHARDFERGLAESTKHPTASLLHQLFQSRSLRLDQQLSADGAASWMSGLLIGTDVRGALSLFEREATAPVYVIGAPQLTQSYAHALEHNGRSAIQVDGTKAAIAGLGMIHREQARRKSA